MGLALAALLPGCGPPRESGGLPQQRTSFLLVTLDTVRADHFGCYGSTLGLTPALDALAAEGVRFERAYSSAAATPMAHASILTGLNPYQHQVRVIAGPSGFHLPATIPTIATVLKSTGRRTGAFLSSFTVSDYYGFERGFDVFDSGIKPGGTAFQADRDGKLRWDVQRNQRRADETTDQLVGWLEAARGPFAAWIHYWDPHDDVHKPPLEFMARFPPRTPQPDAARRALYEAEIAYVDSQFARVVAALRSRGLYDDTLIVVTADHGEGLGDHDWQFHRLLYQEQIRAPLLIKLPRDASARTVSEVVRCTDIYPTVLDYLGCAPPGKVFGRSLRALIEGKPDAPRLAYAEQLNKLDQNSNLVRQRPRDGLLYAIVEGDWKLIYNDEFADAHQLYHLRDDPREQRNLFEREPQRAAALQAKLAALDAFRRTPFEAGQTDPAALRALEALGYAGGTDEPAAPTRPATSAPASRPAPE